MPDPEHLGPHQEAIVSREIAIQEEVSLFKATLDNEAQIEFEQIFGEVGQVQLAQEQERTESTAFIMRFGLFPINMSPLQHAIYALMSAHFEEEMADQITDNMALRVRHIKEADRLRRLAEDIRSK